MDRDDKILTYLQGRMSREDVALFEAEIAKSPDIAAQVAVMRRARAVLGTPPPDLRDDGWDRLSRAIDAQGTPDRAANVNRPIRLSLLQAASVAVAAVIGWSVLQPVLFPSEPGGLAPASAEAEVAVLQVVFVADAPVGEIAALLTNLGASIAEGPGVLGIFRLHFADTAARDNALATLSRRTDLIDEVLVD
ncbi:hypothetical protein [Cognatishimia sp. F0-27]|uniref:hypothetical protein n=1 Tax=Cognatishimia sp. F0-27 TaxID=2816855 RepID=UPI001D0C82F9|nr:hypothetical protein [Cognatishimia sp. F0-27]MCC1491845.1 hypothetical protein [Cognatishimia sp. F0-27]